MLVLTDVRKMIGFFIQYLTGVRDIVVFSFNQYLTGVRETTEFVDILQMPPKFSSRFGILQSLSLIGGFFDIHSLQVSAMLQDFSMS